MKKYFVLKLNPPRATFSQDMTPEERIIMHQHISYWRGLMAQDYVLALGPVMDPAGVYGLAIVAVEEEEQVKEFIKFDPANGLNHYEYYQMMAVVPENKK